MSEKYELGNAIAQVKKYKRKMDKAKGAKKMIYRGLLAFWKEIRDALQADTHNPQANDDDTEPLADTEDPIDHSSNPESDPESGPESEPEQPSEESDAETEESVICDPTEPSRGREDLPPTYA